LFGWRAGLICSIISTAGLYLSWGHFPTFLPFSLEILSVHYAILKRKNPLLVGILYWFSFGWIIVGVEYYFFTGIGSGIIIYIFSNAITIGASGAIMAVLFSYGYLFPNRMLLFYFIPMKAKYCIMILIVLEISQEILRADNISHIGHLGGMLFGFYYKPK
jgi:hypothetical protein